MAAQKHLHELLKEDQEPFHLNKYIADRSCQFKRSNNPPLKPASTSLQVKKRKPITQTATTSTVAKRNLCRHACFFSFHDSPDVRKSPFLDFHSPAKSPIRRNQNGTVFLHIPAKTAALLLEAAMRIQKQQSSSSSSIAKPKSQIKNMGLGLFSSILQKLKDRNKNKKSEIRDTEFMIGRKSDAKKMEENVGAIVATTNEVGVISCSGNNSRLSSAGWSESNEEKSLDMETSASGCGSEEDLDDDMDFVAHQSLNGACASCEHLFCSSPLSPFRFSLQRSPSSGGRRTPDFSSPAATPSRHEEENKKEYEGNGFENGIKLEEEEEEEEEEEKEQCSPVSVLDPPFKDEDEDEDEEDNGHEENIQDYDLECSYAIVQRAKEQLLYKLRRFEKLAELDPVELEKRMLEQLHDEDEDEEQAGKEEEKYVDNELLPLYRGCSLESFVSDVCSKSILQNRRKIPADMKRLVSDLISEEKRDIKGLDNKEILLGRVCKKLDSWKEVESNTIDMMVALDFRNESDLWKRFQEQREETAMEIEFPIFQLLVDELFEELLSSSSASQMTFF